MNSNLNKDLQYVFEHAEDDFNLLAGKKIFLTGGTGFFGKWILYSINHANQILKDPIEVSILSRNPEIFLTQHPMFRSSKWFKFLKGDITNFSYPNEKYDIIFHAATEANDQLIKDSPDAMLETIIQGTKHILNFAKKCNSNKVLLTSSGAVYGKQPNEVSHVPENYLGGPDYLNPHSSYAEGKRLAELLAAIHERQAQQTVLITRCFAFIGPFLPLDMHYAIGNFIGNCLKNENIVIKGNGAPFRSYLYGADLIIWLLKILNKGKSIYPYNVGSENAFQLKEIAEIVIEVWNNHSELKPYRRKELTLEILNPTVKNSPEYYVPSTQRARSELNLKEHTTLQNAILQTFLFHLESKLTTEPK